MTASIEQRTTWRGLIHRYAAIAAVPAFAVLIALADSATQRLACVVYGLGVTTMLGVSAVYHSAGLSMPTKQKLRRVDHSTILFAVAGSYTGIGALALDGSPEKVLLWFVWTAALIGIALRMSWMTAPYWLIAIVNLVVGWSALVEIGPLLDALGGVNAALVVGGGVLYTVGAVVYALHKPNPVPGVFGYHEVFHALVVAGAACHYAASLRLV